MSAQYDHIVCLLKFTPPVGLLYCLVFGLESSLDFIWISIVVNLLAYVFATTGHVACLLRFYAGWFVGDVRKRPLRQLILFDCELDPKCMPVRECLSILDCTAEVYPVPVVDASKTLVDLPVASRFLHELEKRSPTKSTALPYLEDPNTQIVLQGNTNDILLYLYTTYARKGAHRAMQPPLDKGETGLKLAALACKVRSVGNPYGYYAQPSAYNRRPFKLYSYEGCPYSRSVREMLTSLQLHYQLVTCAQGSTGRVQLVHQIGELITPVLYDPETMQLCEGHEECIAYLSRWYDLSAMLSECAIELVDSKLIDPTAEPTPTPTSTRSDLKVSPKLDTATVAPLPTQAAERPRSESILPTKLKVAPSTSSTKPISRKTKWLGQSTIPESTVESDAEDDMLQVGGIQPPHHDDMHDDDDDYDDVDEDGKGVHSLFASASFVQQPLIAPSALTPSASVTDGFVAKLRRQLSDVGPSLLERGNDAGGANQERSAPKVFGRSQANDVSARLLQLGSR